MATDEILTLVEKTALLKSYAVFDAVPTEALATLAARSVERHFEAGDFVFREGEPNRVAVMVVEGRLEVRKRGQFFRVIDPGAGFGQLDLREGDPHTVSVIALTHTHLIWVTIEDLFESVGDFPEIGVGLIRLLAGRVQELLDHVQLLEQDVARLAARLNDAGVSMPAEERKPGGNGARD